MTQFKVGDRVKLVKVGGSVPLCLGYNVGDTATEVDNSLPFSLKIKMDDKKHQNGHLFICSHEIEAITTPPITIQHEGYNYTRGEPVVPEWVKDGAWVVDRETGCIMCLTFSRDDIQAYDIYGRYKVYYPRDSKVMEAVFRPFTNSDWKWGMWAEFHGEKVFVNGRIDNGVTASKPTNGYFFIPFEELTPTTAP